MICPVDRTAEYIGAVAAHHRVSKDKVLLKEQGGSGDRHEFTQIALQVMQSIEEMQTFVHKRQHRYNDYSTRGLKDAERDEIDSAVAQFLRTAMLQIDVIKKDAVDEMKANPGISFSAHKLGVVAILSEDLQALSKLGEDLRSVRIKHAIAEKSKAKVQYDAGVARQLAEEVKNGGEFGSAEDGDDDFGLLEQEFARENASLVTELVETREQVREAEQTIFEIASLNHVFATKVLEQAREIEVLYDLAVEATNYVGRGNRELGKMKQRGPIVKYGVAFLALWLGLALLFLEYMSKRRSLFFL